MCSRHCSIFWVANGHLHYFPIISDGYSIEQEAVEVIFSKE
jgi:hypothetical protein